jgi:hypothetical protein
MNNKRAARDGPSMGAIVQRGEVDVTRHTLAQVLSARRDPRKNTVGPVPAKTPAMTLLARLAPRPKARLDKPSYPRALAFAAAALLGACGGVVTSSQEATPDTTSPVNSGGGAPAPNVVEDGGTGGTGGSAYVPPTEPGGVVDAPYIVPDAGVAIPIEAGPEAAAETGWPNPAGGEPVTFDAAAGPD